jgi:nucleosome binding factor SPN SPT16 subunit
MELTSWQKLDKYFSKKSMMEIMGVDRDENAHSNFLAWLFENEETGKHACKLLIELLQQDKLSIDKISKVKVTREAFVQSTYEKNESGEIVKTHNNSPGTEVKGRTDIVIDLLDSDKNVFLKIS